MNTERNTLLIRTRLQYDDDFALKCLKLLYEKQEADEQVLGQVTHVNGVGFNKTDAPAMTLYADILKEHKDSKLDRNMMAHLHEALPKYAKQLSGYLTDEEVEE